MVLINTSLHEIKSNNLHMQKRCAYPRSPKSFNINFYLAVLDTAINSVSECFEQLNKVNSVFGFLYDIYALQYKTSQQIMKSCKKLESVLHVGDSRISILRICVMNLKLYQEDASPPQHCLDLKKCLGYFANRNRKTVLTSFNLPVSVEVENIASLNLD